MINFFSKLNYYRVKAKKELLSVLYKIQLKMLLD